MLTKTGFTVAFDASTAAFQKKTGTGVYCEELIKAYQSRFINDKIIHTYRLSRRLKGAEHLLPVPKNADREILLDPWTYFKGSKYDIFHGLNSRLPLLTGTKMIATVHDLFSIYGEFSDVAFREDQAKKLRQMIDRADHIVVPATFTKNELITKMEIPSDKITVVSEGVRPVYLQPRDRGRVKAFVQQNFKLKSPYFLFVGSLEKRKNVKGLVEAFAIFKSKTKSAFELVLVGSPGFQHGEIEEAVAGSGYASSIRRLGFVGEVSLAELYTACEGFVFPSLEEGFGIPVIEAMACGVPVITSTTTSLPEVANGHAWLVNPREPKLIAETMEAVAGGGQAVIERSQAGQTYARHKTWTRVAEETREVYWRVLERD